MTCFVGYGLALLTGGGFDLVCFHLPGGRKALYTVPGFGLVQLVVHFRCFLPIDPTRFARADLQPILLSRLVIVLMAAGTLVVLFNLHDRMT